MEEKYLIANFGEIFLKGGNISFFEEKLYSNFLKKISSLKNKIIFEKRRGGSFYIKLSKKLSIDEEEKIERAVATTPGFSTYYFAWATKTEMESLKKTASELALIIFQKKRNIKNFGIKTEKIDRETKIKTKDVNVEVGSAVWTILNKEKKIDVFLDKPDLKIYIKIKKNKSFIFSEIKKGVGGLPVGSAGRGIALFSGGIDSPVAAYLAIKRGLEIVAVHFHSIPQTSPKSIEKVKELVQKLSEFQGGIKLYLIPIIPIQKNIVQNTERKVSIVLQRRAFIQIALKISEKEKIKAGAIITGDSLGQVASQTLENMIAVSETLEGSDKIILRPLISFDKNEIIEMARKINTLDISEKPHDDACSLFVPKNPETKANLFFIKEEEKKLNLDLLEQAIKNSEILIF